MASNINVFINGFRATGQNVNFPQYEVNITAEWVDRNREPHTRTELVRFPNILANAALDNDWRKEKLEELMLAAIRKIAGVDD